MIENSTALSGIFLVIFKLCILLAFTFVLKLKPKIFENFENTEEIIAKFDLNKKIISDHYKEAKLALSEIKKMSLEYDELVHIYKNRLEEIVFLIDKKSYLPEFQMDSPKNLILKIQERHQNFLK